MGPSMSLKVPHSDLEVQRWAEDIRAQLKIPEGGVYNCPSTREAFLGNLRKCGFDERSLELAMAANDTFVIWAKPSAENEFGPVCP